MVCLNLDSSTCSSAKDDCTALTCKWLPVAFICTKLGRCRSRARLLAGLASGAAAAVAAQLSCSMHGELQGDTTLAALPACCTSRAVDGRFQSCACMQANFETERECVGAMEAALVELVQSWLVGFQLLGTVSRAPPSRVSAGSAHRDPACLPCTCMPVHCRGRMQLQQRA